MASRPGNGDGSLASNIKSATYGLLFFGVPRRSEEAYNNLAMIMAQDDKDASNRSERTLMNALKRDVIWLRETGAEYSQMCVDLAIKQFSESSDGSAPEKPHNMVNSIPLAKSHGQMIKFPSSEDMDYQKVSRLLLVMYAEATKTTSSDLSRGIELDMLITDDILTGKYPNIAVLQRVRS